MKKASIIFLCMLYSACLSAQKREVCFPWSKVSIPIHANELTDCVIDSLYQDFEAEDHTYEVFIIEKSPLRFKVEYRDLEDQTPSVSIGWVDKKYCGVWDREYYDQQNRGFIKLFENPSFDSDYIKIYEQPFHAMTVVDYRGKFLQVMFEIDNTIYTGWIDRYCPNIFNSCT